VISAVTDEALRGVRLDRAVATIDGVGSRVRAVALLEDGRVRVDGAVRPKSFRVGVGMRIDIDAEPVAEPSATSGPAPRALVPTPRDGSDGVVIVYADDDLLVVDKPAGLVTHPAPGTRVPTLVEALLDRGIAGGGDRERPGVVHRLDRDTSGLLVVARSEAAHAELGRLLRKRSIERTYTALVHGRPGARAGRIEAPIGRDARNRTRMAVDGIGGRAATTHFTLIEALARFSLLELRLETGRTHQIRVHLEAIGHPVVGDPVYAAASAERLGLDRQLLHASRLAFPHPRTGAALSFDSPLPADLAAALARARAESGPESATGG